MFAGGAGGRLKARGDVADEKERRGEMKPRPGVGRRLVRWKASSPPAALDTAPGVVAEAVDDDAPAAELVRDAAPCSPKAASSAARVSVGAVEVPGSGGWEKERRDGVARP